MCSLPQPGICGINISGGTICQESQSCLACVSTQQNAICTVCNGYYLPSNGAGRCVSSDPTTLGLNPSNINGQDLLSVQDAIFQSTYLNKYEYTTNDTEFNVIQKSQYSQLTETTMQQFAYQAVGTTPIVSSYKAIMTVSCFFNQIPQSFLTLDKVDRLTNIASTVSVLAGAGGDPSRFTSSNDSLHIYTIEQVQKMIQKGVIIAQSLSIQTVGTQQSIFQLMGACNFLLYLFEQFSFPKAMLPIANSVTQQLNTQLTSLFRIYAMARIADTGSKTQIKANSSENIYFTNRKELKLQLNEIPILSSTIVPQQLIVAIGPVQITVNKEALQYACSTNGVLQQKCWLLIAYFDYNPYKFAQNSSINCVTGAVQTLAFQGTDQFTLQFNDQDEFDVTYQFTSNTQYAMSPTFDWLPIYWQSSINAMSSDRFVGATGNFLTKANATIVDSSSTVSSNILAFQTRNPSVVHSVSGACYEGYVLAAQVVHQDQLYLNRRVVLDPTNCAAKCDAACQTCYGLASNNCIKCPGGFDAHPLIQQNGQYIHQCNCQGQSGKILSSSGDCVQIPSSYSSLTSITTLDQLTQEAYLSLTNSQRIRQLLDVLNTLSQSFTKNNEYEQAANILSALTSSQLFGQDNETAFSSCLQMLNFTQQSALCDIACVEYLMNVVDNMLFILTSIQYQQLPPSQTRRTVFNAIISSIIPALKSKIIYGFRDYYSMPQKSQVRITTSRSETVMELINYVQSDEVILRAIVTGTQVQLPKVAISKITQQDNANIIVNDNNTVDSVVGIALTTVYNFNIYYYSEQVLDNGVPIVLIEAASVIYDSNDMPTLSYPLNGNQISTLGGFLQIKFLNYNSNGCFYVDGSKNYKGVNGFWSSKTDFIISIVSVTSASYNCAVKTLQNTIFSSLNYKYILCPASFYASTADLKGCLTCQDKVLVCQANYQMLCSGKYNASSFSSSSQQQQCKCSGTTQKFLLQSFATPSTDTSSYVYQCVETSQIQNNFLQATLVTFTNSTFLPQLEQYAFYANSSQQLQQVCAQLLQIKSYLTQNQNTIAQTARLLGAISYNTFYNEFNCVDTVFQVVAQLTADPSLQPTLADLDTLLETFSFTLSIFQGQFSSWVSPSQLSSDAATKDYIQNVMNTFNKVRLQYVQSVINAQSALTQSPDNYQQFTGFTSFTVGIARIDSENEVTLSLASFMVGLYQNSSVQYTFNYTAQLFEGKSSFPYYIVHTLYKISPYAQMPSITNSISTFFQSWGLQIFQKNSQSVLFEVTDTFNAINDKSYAAFYFHSYNASDINECWQYDALSQSWKAAYQALSMSNANIFQQNLQACYPTKLYQNGIYRIIKTGTKIAANASTTNTCPSGQYLDPTSSCQMCPADCSECLSATQCIGNCGIFGPPINGGQCGCAADEVNLISGDCVQKAFAKNMFEMRVLQIRYAQNLSQLLDLASFAGQTSSQAVNAVLLKALQIANGLNPNSQQDNSSALTAGLQLLIVLLDSTQPAYLQDNTNLIQNLTDMIVFLDGDTSTNDYQSLLNSLFSYQDFLGKAQRGQQEAWVGTINNALARYLDLSGNNITDQKSLLIRGGTQVLFQKITGQPLSTGQVLQLSSDYPSHSVQITPALFSAISSNINASQFYMSVVGQHVSQHMLSSQRIVGNTISVNVYYKGTNTSKYSPIQSNTIRINGANQQFAISFGDDSNIDNTQICVFWNQALSKWDSDQLLKSGNTCLSNHLTDFALMNINDVIKSACKLFILFQIMLNILMVVLTFVLCL